MPTPTTSESVCGVRERKAEKRKVQLNTRFAQSEEKKNTQLPTLCSRQCVVRQRQDFHRITMYIFTEQCCTVKVCQCLRYIKKETIDLLKKALPEGIRDEADCQDNPSSQTQMWCKKCSKSLVALDFEDNPFSQMRMWCKKCSKSLVKFH